MRQRSKQYLRVGFLALFGVLIGCGVRPPISGVEAKSSVQYKHFIVIPYLADDLRVEWSDASKINTSTETGIGWDTASTAGKIVSEILYAHGATTVTELTNTNANFASASIDDQTEAIWQFLTKTNQIGNAEAILIFRQNALDIYGRQYSPATDFFSSGLVGLAVGAATTEERFNPAFVLAVNVGVHRTMIGPSRCNIGFDARMLDARTGKQIGGSDAVLGQEFLQDNAVINQSWIEMRLEERETVKTYCFSALRRALSQALSEIHAVR